MASLPIELFGHRVIAKIGTGAASEVYVVQDLKTKQVWALKHVIRVDQKSERFIEQVEQEYSIGSKLDHESIRGIHKLLRIKKLFTTTEVGLLMELVDAGTLETHKFKNIAEAIRLFAQIARGLEHMNSRGFVHGDMKPINVMVTDKKQVKIIDLGQACPVDHVKVRIQGTPGYIAPEQANREAITAQTDVYNFGAMVYWVLARKVIPTVLPPQGEAVSASPLSANMVKLPEPLHTLNRNIPVELSHLVQECVQLNPQDRVQGMGQVAERLESLVGSLGDTHMGLKAVGA
jgi:eukaryotic-like serine/threonine-protein kinase